MKFPNFAELQKQVEQKWKENVEPEWKKVEQKWKENVEPEWQKVEKKWQKEVDPKWQELESKVKNMFGNNGEKVDIDVEKYRREIEDYANNNGVQTRRHHG